MLTATDQKLQKIIRWYDSASNWHSSDVTMDSISFLYDIAVFDLSPLTLCINCFLYLSID